MSLEPMSRPTFSRHQSNLKWCLGALVLGVVSAVLWMRHRAPQQTSVVWPTVERTNLVWRAGQWYSPHGTNEFTGWMVESYPDGSRLSRTAVSNGLLNGICESWFTNGQLRSIEHFKNGVSDGLREKWYENGRCQSRANIVNGAIEGVFRRWYPNGRLAERIPMKSGRPNGLALDYYPSGFARAKTRVRAGQVLGRTVWKDGHHRVSE